MRQSNIELLRIISIFLILVVHADFLILGMPGSYEVESAFLPTSTRIFFEMLSIICVDIFVFISGWFGMRASLKGLCKLLFQVFFILALILGISIACGQTTFSIESIAGILMFDKYFWFVKAYIGLLILSPVINIFIKNASFKTLCMVLSAYYIFQTIYAFLTDGAWFLESGYCITSLSAIYLLGRLFKISVENKVQTGLIGRLLKWNQMQLISCFFVIVFFNTALFLLTFYVPMGNYIRPRIVYYTNPLVIFQSVVLFLFFLKCKFKNNSFINWIAASSFAVFVVHVSQGMKYFRELITYIYYNNWGIGCLLLIMLALIGVYVISILIDQIRIFFWNKIQIYIPSVKIEE